MSLPWLGATSTCARLFFGKPRLLYGEGRAKAFGRLQEAIYNMMRDDSIFLFRYSHFQGSLPLLPDSPTRFCPRAGCDICGHGEFIRCLEPEVAYEDIIASKAWAVQAHEQMLTTVTPQRFEMSTTLMLIDKAVLPRSLLQMHEVALRRT